MIWAIIDEESLTISDDITEAYVLNNDKLSIPQQFIINYQQSRPYVAQANLIKIAKSRGINLEDDDG